MSRSQSAYLDRKDVPTRRDLQQALDMLGFKVTIDDTYVPFESSGYLPCTIDGEDSGFTIKFQDVDLEVARAAELRSRLGGKDVEITFRWGTDPREVVCVMAVGAALLGSFGAIVAGTDDGACYSTDDLIGKARKAADLLE